MKRIIAVLILGVLSAGCCALRTRGRIPDRLEAYVILGFDEPPCCPRRPQPFVGRQIKPGEPLKGWARAVRFDRLRAPLPGRAVRLDVVDPFGKPVGSDTAELSPSEVRTAANGFNFEPIVFRSGTRGEYLIRATYADKGASTFSYSAPILVHSEATN